MAPLAVEWQTVQSLTTVTPWWQAAHWPVVAWTVMWCVWEMEAVPTTVVWH
jgi:hypothetical protein